MVDNIHMFGKDHPETGEEMRAPRFGAVINTLRFPDARFLVIEIASDSVQAGEIKNDGVGLPGTIEDREVGKTFDIWPLERVFEACKVHVPDEIRQAKFREQLEKEQASDHNRHE